MASVTEKLAKSIHDLSEAEKLKIVDLILVQLDRPDPELDKIWADESRKRWSAYKSGSMKTVSYDKVMAKHRSK